MPVFGLFFALFLAAASPGVAQNAPGTVVGEVRTMEGAPVGEVEVVLAPAQGGAAVRTVTDAAGRFRVSATAGVYRLRTEALGYRQVERAIEVPAGGTAEAELRLEVAPVGVSGLVVSAARTSAPAGTLPASVKVVSGDAVAEQAAVSTGLAGVLAKTVPGLTAPTGTSSLFGQTFRGRNMAVLIDGVPQSTGRNAMRDLETIDPSAIERVEVLGGATAIYGDGATGGVINLITRKPVPGRRLTTGVSVEGAPESPGSSAGMRLMQSLAGQSGAVDYLVTGSVSTVGSHFDGEGDRIPADPQGQGGLADYRTVGVLAKVGVSGGTRRAELSVNRYTGLQTTEFTTDPSVNAVAPGEEKARAIEGLDLSEPTGTENLNVVASYRDGALLGGELRAQAFFRDYQTRFGPFDGRSYLSHVAQSFVDSRKLGGRAELEMSPSFLSEARVVWGVDYTNELSYQGLNLMDPELYDASGGLTFRKIGEAKWVPEIQSAGVGLFAQVGWTPWDRLSLRGGVRHERVRMHVDDFTTITGNAVEGGDLDYAPVLLNAGAVFHATEAVDLFGSYGQGFSLADIGRVLRGAPAGFTLGSKQLGAQLVDHYEAGVRGHWTRFQASAAAFTSRSDLGTTLDAQLDVIRAPERIRGFEASLDAQPAPALGLGGSFTWSEGESQNLDSGEWVALNGFRIQPVKVTGYVEHRTRSWWTNRLQGLHSGSRDRAFEAGLTYGHLPVESYTVLDWLSTLQVGPGRLDVGVQNLLDTQYFPVVSQLYAQWGNSTRAAARGRTLSLGYTVTY